eukprot:1287667-Pleurochrysis_carterae.AAC.1
MDDVIFKLALLRHLSKKPHHLNLTYAEHPKARLPSAEGYDGALGAEPDSGGRACHYSSATSFQISKIAAPGHS